MSLEHSGGFPVGYKALGLIRRECFGCWFVVFLGCCGEDEGFVLVRSEEFIAKYVQKTGIRFQKSNF